MAPTHVFSHSDIEAFLEPDLLFAQIKQGFAALAESGPDYEGYRFPVALPAMHAEGAGMVLAPGLLPGIPAYTIKVNSKFPGHPPAIKGAVLLFSLEDGQLLAVLDSSSLTAFRTAVSGAVGADVLARKDAASVSIIGCGVQGRGQLEWMTRIRNIRQAYFHDIVPQAAEALAEEARQRLGLSVDVIADAREAARRGDIVVTATWASQPFLFAGDICAGTHVTTLGPDGPNEAELSADALREARFFADDAALQVQMGAIGGAGLDASAIAAEIGEVLAGLKPGRVGEQDITVYGMVGVPFQDLAAAWQVYQAAAAKREGRTVDLSA